MRSSRVALAISALMLAAALAAVAARPEVRGGDLQQALFLGDLIPHEFGGWQEERQRLVEVVNPQRQAAVQAAYEQTLERIFVNPDGYRIMLSLAYGSDHRGSLRTHEPEACYPGQGFKVHSREVLRLETPYGEIPVRRLLASKGPRVEPVTYWIKVGDKAVMPSESKLVELGYILTGRVPDGLLFRVSSIDRDQARANRMHEHFINQLLQAVGPSSRKLLSGLDT